MMIWQLPQLLLLSFQSRHALYFSFLALRHLARVRWHLEIILILLKYPGNQARKTVVGYSKDWLVVFQRFSCDVRGNYYRTHA